MIFTINSKVKPPKKEWERWFAWHPITIKETSTILRIVWLEWVEREIVNSSFVFGEYWYNYRLPDVR
jgi:hypothetical protein